MNNSITAEEALQRAKEIAARLSGQTATTMAMATTSSSSNPMSYTIVQHHHLEEVDQSTMGEYSDNLASISNGTSGSMIDPYHGNQQNGRREDPITMDNHQHDTNTNNGGNNIDTTTISTTATTSTTSGTSTSYSTSGSKRKRWGVASTTTTNNSAGVVVVVGSEDEQGTTSTGSKILKQLLNPIVLLPSNNSNSSTANTTTATQQPLVIVDVKQQRIWITTKKDRPAAHYVAFLTPKIPEVITTIEGPEEENQIREAGTTSTSTSTDNIQTDKRNSNRKKASKSEAPEESGRLIIELGGRGSSSKPPPPGMPLEPLHILIRGKPTSVDRAELMIDELLMQAERAPVEVPLEDFNSISMDVGGGGALVTMSSLSDPTRRMQSVGTYRPASVAQLIGKASMPPEAAAALALASSNGELMEETIHVPNGVVGFIIGRGGENITSMQGKTGCKVQIQKEHELQPGQTHRVITLCAMTQTAINECRQIIENMVQEKVRASGGGSSIGVLSNAAVGASGMNGNVGGNSSKDNKIQEALASGHKLIKIEVPDADVGLVIGKMGSTIKSIQDQTGANIQVPPSGNPDNPAVRTVNITHPSEEGALLAKQLIENILNARPNQAVTRNPQVTIQVLIPDKDVGLCIGRQGCVIRQMQSSTNTRIQIPSQPLPGETHRVASVSGSAEGCSKVQEMIHRIISEQSSAPVLSPGQPSLATGVGPGVQASQHNSYGQPQQQYSAEWAAYHAAQAAAQQQQQEFQQQQHLLQQQHLQRQQQQLIVQTAVTEAGAGFGQQLTADAYYEQFFRYAYYYGEEAARQYYGAWSPPVGTPNPYGVNPAGIQPAPVAAPVDTAQAVPSHPYTQNQQPPPDNGKETSRRKVSNLPAWMTKG